MRIRQAGQVFSIACALALAVVTNPADLRAETTVRLAQQRGLTYLPLILIEHGQLLEKNAADAGLGEVDVTWTRFAGGTPMNDALLSGNLDFAATGLPAFSILWDKAEQVMPIRGLTSYGTAPLYLVSRRPEVKSIEDFTDQDRIAVPAVKASAQAIMLQMEAEKRLGSYDALDHLTVSLSHPDAMTALMSPSSEITAHFGAPPYIFHELEETGMHRVLSNYDIFGGPVSNGILYTTEEYHDENPKIIDALMKSLTQAIEMINTDARRAAEIYLEVSQEKATVDEIYGIITHPGMIFELTPRNTFTYASFMHRIGTLDRSPSDWKDLFFETAHGMPGS